MLIFEFSRSELVWLDMSFVKMASFDLAAILVTVLERGPPFWIEVINWFCWSTIPNKTGIKAITYYNWKNIGNIGAILEMWECPQGFVQNGCHDVIKFKFSKNEKDDPRKYPREDLCEFSSKSDQHTHTHTHTYRHPRFDSNIFRMTEYKKWQPFNRLFFIILCWGSKHNGNFSYVVASTYCSSVILPSLLLKIVSSVRQIRCNSAKWSIVHQNEILSY